MNPHRFKVKDFVAVQYRRLWFGNYRAVGDFFMSHLLLAGGCISHPAWFALPSNTAPKRRYFY
ncbi:MULTISPECIES: hypothetical protein [Phyllobacterium]|uniref:hypothetical protein n=1 Tax=unclassified Phyllobacterium TaxID=2638441 RepID=UPI0031FC69F3|nr:hypothetical protein [Phyllobacterium sp.]